MFSVGWRKLHAAEQVNVIANELTETNRPRGGFFSPFFCCIGEPLRLLWESGSDLCLFGGSPIQQIKHPLMIPLNTPVSLHELFSMYRKELGYSLVACIVAVTRHWQARDPFREIVTNGILVAVVAFGMTNILEFFSIDSGTWGYLASVLLGYVGVNVLFDVIAARIPFLKSVTKDRSQTDVQTK